MVSCVCIEGSKQNTWIMASRAAARLLSRRAWHATPLPGVALAPSASVRHHDDLALPRRVEHRETIRRHKSTKASSGNNGAVAATEGDTDTEAEADAPKKPPVKMSIVRVLAAMVDPSRNRDGFPTAHRISLAFRRAHGGRVDDLESKLLRHFTPKDTALKRVRDELAAFDSKKAMAMWAKGKRMQALRALTDAFSNIVTDGDPKNAVHRVFYVCFFHRLGSILEDVVGGRDAEELQLVEKFCAECASKHESQVAAFYFWLALIKSATSSSDANLESAHRLVSTHPELLDLLDTELFVYAREYSQIDEKPTSVLYHGMPGVFVLGEIESFTNKLLNSLERYRLADVTLAKVVAYKSLALWNGGQCAKALTQLAASMEVWLKGFADEKTRTELGFAVLVSLREMLLKTEKKIDLAPAHEFLELVCEKQSQAYGTDLVPYVYWVLLSELDTKRADSLLRKYPGLSHLRDERVERHLISESSISSKTHFFTKWLRALDPAQVKRIAEASPTLEQEVDTTADPDQQPLPMSDDTKQELLDIRVLEMLQTPPSEGESAHGELLSTLAGADGITPSDSVLMSVVDAYLSDANSEKLSDLLLVLPLKSAAADRVYEHKISERLRRNYRERWVIGRRHEAIEEVLNCHQTVLEEDFHISDAALASLTTRLNNYIRLYIEVLMEEREKEKDPTSPAFAACLRAFQLIENKGRFIADVSKDYSVLINYWEALFFSPEFRSQEEADKMLEENPQLARYLDANHLLGRAHRSGSESLFRKLVEISLRYNLDEYEKTRFFEGLLVHQCEAGNPVSSSRTVEYAEKSGISIGADAMSHYVSLKAETKTKKGPLASLARYWPWK